MRYLIIFILFSFFGRGQNLVPNGGFENYTILTNPNGYTDYSYLSNWINPNNASPDLWTNTITLNNVPNNYSGNQYPHKGKAYVGICTSWAWVNPADAIDSNYSEYISVRLQQPLTQGKSYCFSMWVSMADSAMMACAPLGILFSSAQVYQPIYTNLSYTPQILFNQPVLNDSDWVQLHTSFIANGTEQWITIGNFKDYTGSNNIKIHNWSGIGYNNQPGSYYYIDNVWLGETCEPPYDSVIVPNVFTPNEDGVNDVWSFSIGGGTNIKCTIYNRWGNEIYMHKSMDKEAIQIVQWDGSTTSGEKVSDGVYFYVLEYRDYNGDWQKLKGTISIFR